MYTTFNTLHGSISENFHHYLPLLAYKRQTNNNDIKQDKETSIELDTPF